MITYVGNFLLQESSLPFCHSFYQVINFEKINYNLVPNIAKNKLRNAFIRHDGKRYLKYKGGRISKIQNPHDLIRQYSYTIKLNNTIENNWKEELLKYNSDFSNVRICIDTSSCMYIRKSYNKYNFNKFFLDVSMSIGLIISHKTNIMSNFKKIIQFSPKDNLLNRIIKINTVDLPTNKNISKIIDSFSEFNIIIISAQKLNLEYYKKNRIIYWNISDDPIKISVKDNLTEIFGYCKEFVQLLLKNKKISYENLITEIISNSHYNLIKNKL